MSKGPELGSPTDAIERAVVMQTHGNIPEKIEREKVIVVPHDGIADFEAHNLSQLGDPRIRVNAFGELFIKKFMNTNIQVELPNFPPSTDIGIDKLEIVKSLWPRHPDIESAIRSTRHIADSYDRKNGNETLSLLNIHRAIQRFGRELQKPREERMPWDKLKEQAVRVTVKEGFDSAYDKDKVDIGKLLIQAVWEDKIGRENPSRTRLMLAHLHPRITKMLLANTNKYNKYRFLESVLYQEREKERFPFVAFVQMVKQLEDMDHNNREFKNLEKRIRRQAHSMLAPGRVRVAPYVQIAAEARYKMFGHNTPEEKANLVRYVGSEYAEELVKLPTFYDLTPEDRIQRLFEIADTFDKYLKYTDKQLPEVPVG